MYREQTRFGKNPYRIVRAAPTTFNSPLRWGAHRKIFTCSWSDFFIAEADPWREEAWEIIRRTPYLTYQILTKRPENVLSRLPKRWLFDFNHVWLGVSVESQAQAHRMAWLSEFGLRVKFVSYEPALGPIDIWPHAQHIHWLISGGESGPNARPSDLQWFLDVRDQCKELGVAFFHKQNGGTVKTDGSWGGCELAGEIHREFPKEVV
jgi:protein gp37